jgi:ketopantoate hydroxymethyltransferase
LDIEAGVSVEEHILVYRDMLGLNLDFKLKFLRTYAKGFDIFATVLDSHAAMRKWRSSLR